VLLLGILGNVVYQFFFIFGMEATRAGNASLLLATTPVWTTALSTLRGHETIPTKVWIGITGTVAGMALVVWGSGEPLGLEGATLRGDFLLVGAAITWSIYTVGARNLVRRYGSLPVTAWTLWAGTIGLILVGAPPLIRSDLSQVSALAWLGVAYAGALAIGTAYALWYRGVQRLGNTRTAAYSNLVPVVALLVAWLWIGEVPGSLQLLGAVVIIGSLSLARLSGRVTPPRSGLEPPPPAEEGHARRL
jgi:drug/metabolite transporter (DMT)-like permease